MYRSLITGRRWLVVLLGAVLSVALLAGCSSGSGGAAGSTVGGAGSTSGSYPSVSSPPGPSRSVSSASPTGSGATGAGTDQRSSVDRSSNGSASSAALPGTSSAAGTASSTGAASSGADPGFGLPAVQIVSPPASGAGTRPTFSWKPVAGAKSYAFTISTAADGPLWAWQGTATSVILGGWAKQPPDGAPGPLVSDGDTWMVAALDAKGVLLAISLIRPVAP